MSAVLASVRTLDEACLVADCGVPWIDLKEPLAGALGAVPQAVIAAVVRRFGTTHVVSATIGDCWTTPALIPARVGEVTHSGATYAKVGLFARQLTPALCVALEESCSKGIGVIGVCFAEAPPGVAEIEQLAALGLAGLMLDTATKSGPGLVALMEASALAVFVHEVRRRGMLCGLAGKLVADDLDRLLPLGADYLGFRSALCVAGERNASVDRELVERLCARFELTARKAPLRVHSP